MSKYGFLSVLEEELEKNLAYDFAIDWDKKNHAVEVIVVLEAQNQGAVETVDEVGEVSDEDILFEDAILFYHRDKSRFDAEDYLATFPFEPKKGLSREFLAYVAQHLQEVLDTGLSDLMDFLSDDSIETFGLEWKAEEFEAGKAELEETEWHGYPRY